MANLPIHPAPLRPAAPSLIVLALLALIAFAAGCGAKSDAPASDSSTPAAGAPAASAPASDSAAGGTPAAGAIASAEDLGERTFKARCVVCHGPDGHGNGPGAAGLNPKPRNFHDKAYMSTRTDEQLLATIHSGKGAMPRWQGILSEAEMKAVLAYVRAFADKP